MNQRLHLPRSIGFFDLLKHFVLLILLWYRGSKRVLQKVTPDLYVWNLFVTSLCSINITDYHKSGMNKGRRSGRFWERKPCMWKFPKLMLILGEWCLSLSIVNALLKSSVVLLVKYLKMVKKRMNLKMFSGMKYQISIYIFGI